MRTRRWLALLGLATALSPLYTGCELIGPSACDFPPAGMCEEGLSEYTCTSHGGVYYDGKTCDEVDQPG